MKSVTQTSKGHVPNRRVQFGCELEFSEQALEAGWEKAGCGLSTSWSWDSWGSHQSRRYQKEVRNKYQQT